MRVCAFFPQVCGHLGDRRGGGEKIGMEKHNEEDKFMLTKVEG